MRPASSVLVVSPRYADDLLSAVMAAGFTAIPVRRPDDAVGALHAIGPEAEPIRLVIVDARGALDAGLAAARSLGQIVQSRLGAMLVLLSRADGISAVAAHEAGATSVLISPFGHEALGNSLRMAARHVDRLTSAALPDPADPSEPPVDRLTGLATGDHLEHWIAGRLAAPEPQSLFVLAIGIGRLAPINAAYGRDIADQALVAAANRLAGIVETRSTDGHASEHRLLARLAAAEFGLALSAAESMSDINQFALSITRAFDQAFAIGDHVIHLSARVGIAMVEARGPSRATETATTLVRRANSALVGARTREAGTVEVFTHHPAGDPLTRMANLEAELHRAMDGGGIHLLYQPQLSLADGRITGVEALVRWDHPELGLLPANTVLKTAASAELAVRLGRYIRARALTEAAGWKDPLAGLYLSVNVTAADLADPRFVSSLDLALEGSGFPRDRLILEVTEGALIDDVRGAARLLEGLRATGIRVALDDFGTGYSSMSWLARLPIDTIKLDRSFTLGLTANPRERLVVETLVTLGKQLGLAVVVEGVEDDAHLEAARRAGADAVQGYRIAPPLTAVSLGRFCLGWNQQPAPIEAAKG
ncbi:putative bifunctional diguanylate cyclase/phosphodiesterase [Polymorphobacter sp.]|uniref:putative bifunctional diguanylate cyclase/phosphodiesterase n=1 Tax=Polymorphobacter sp. TaxID=1909290 RepID=UPI003F6EC762